MGASQSVQQNQAEKDTSLVSQEVFKDFDVLPAERNVSNDFILLDNGTKPRVEPTTENSSTQQYKPSPKALLKQRRQEILQKSPATHSILPKPPRNKIQRGQQRNPRR